MSGAGLSDGHCLLWGCGLLDDVSYVLDLIVSIILMFGALSVTSSCPSYLVTNVAQFRTLDGASSPAK